MLVNCINHIVKAAMAPCFSRDYDELRLPPPVEPTALRKDAAEVLVLTPPKPSMVVIKPQPSKCVAHAILPRQAYDCRQGHIFVVNYPFSHALQDCGS
ncbi:hypothetical protein J6590_020127 [Homalodisca vitripennis]|nr:hypothetical protein J6590_020127 [Homalodisca vitripennis]